MTCNHRQTIARLKDAGLVLFSVMAINFVVVALIWCEYVNRVMWLPQFQAVRVHSKDAWWMPQWHRKLYPAMYGDTL